MKNSGETSSKSSDHNCHHSLFFIC